MNLKFNSNITQNGEKNRISFESKVEISTFEKFTVYEFEDPKSKTMNRIEVSKNEVNIFVGPATLNLELKKRVPVAYETEQGSFIINTFLIELKQATNKVEFRYTLETAKNELIGEYDLTLEVGV